MSRKAEPGTEKRREYFPLYFSYGKRLASLTDEQMGIVVRAALQYAESGTIPELEPVCRLALDNIIYDIDRASSSYEDICRQNRENGEKGADPKTGQKNRTVLPKTGRFLRKPKKPNTKTNTKTKTKTKRILHLLTQMLARSRSNPSPRRSRKKPLRWMTVR